MENVKYKLAGVLCAGLLTACSYPSVVTMPTSARSYQPMVMPVNNGSIYQPQTAVMLFEENLARNVGDVVTIQISESLETSDTSNTTIGRKTSVQNTGTADDGAPAIIRTIMGRNNFSGTGDSQFKGNGSIANKNGVTATLAATVIDVLPNGNLLIGGDKRVSLHGQQSVLRVTGVIRRKDIQSGNIVSSKKIADARIELVGQGTVSDANTMSWMQKIFLSLSPI